MKNVIIEWNKKIFDGTQRLLPDSLELFSYTKLNDESAWTVLFNFSISPRNQGYTSKGTVKFVSEKAPKNILIEGFTFEIFDGPNSIANCKIYIKEKLFLKDIKEKINFIEAKKAELQEYVKIYKHSNEIKYDDNLLCEIMPYINEYPYLFSLIIRLDVSSAYQYLIKYFLTEPLEDKVVYESNLSFFLYTIKNECGNEELSKFINALSLNVRNDVRVKKALDEIF